MKQPKQVLPTTKKKKDEESLSYSVEVRDQKGRVLQRISAPSRSFVEQWNQLINLQASGTNKTIKDTGGVNRVAQPYSVSFRTNAAIGDVNKGIRIGKGTTAVVIDDFALESPLDEGTGIDEFEHQGMVYTAPSVVGSTCSFTARRTLINDSGATISDIREIGCYTEFYDGTYRFALGFRDVLPGAVTVPHGGSITVTYTIPVTV